MKRRGRPLQAGGPRESHAYFGLLLLRGALDGGGRAVAARNLDAAWLALLGLGDPHLEDAVVELGLDAVGVDAIRQAQRAREAAERTLDAVEAALGLLALLLALTRDLQRAVLDLDRDVLVAQARKVCLQNEVIVRLDQIHRRDPAARGPRPPPGAAQGGPGYRGGGWWGGPGGEGVFRVRRDAAAGPPAPPEGRP